MSWLHSIMRPRNLACLSPAHHPPVSSDLAWLHSITRPRNLAPSLQATTLQIVLMVSSDVSGGPLQPARSHTLREASQASSASSQCWNSDTHSAERPSLLCLHGFPDSPCLQMLLPLCPRTLVFFIPPPNLFTVLRPPAQRSSYSLQSCLSGLLVLWRYEPQRTHRFGSAPLCVALGSQQWLGPCIGDNFFICSMENY